MKFYRRTHGSRFILVPSARWRYFMVAFSQVLGGLSVVAVCEGPSDLVLSILL